MNRVRKVDGFTLVELLVVIAIIGVLAVALLPAIGLVTGEANKIADRKNLDKIYQNASAAAEGGIFPFSRKEGATAIDHFNEMLKNRTVRSTIKPDVFKSPVQNELIAEIDTDGEFKLTPLNLSYTYSKKPIRTGQTKAPLSSNSKMAIGDSDEGHEGGVHVLFPDGVVEFCEVGQDKAAAILEGYIFPQSLVDAEGKGPDKIPAEAK